MRLLFVCDPLNRPHAQRETTSLMLHVAREHGHDTSVCDCPDLATVHGEAVARATPVSVNIDQQSWVTSRAASVVPLASFDAIFMRTDPPVDDRFIYATMLLEHAERLGVAIVNRPSALRDLNEKLSILRFPDIAPACAVTSDIAHIEDFAAQYDAIVLKPLNSMGGRGILRFERGDPNLASAAGLLTNGGQLPLMAQEFLPQIHEETGGDCRVFIVHGAVIPLMLRRLPKSGDFRANLAAGGSGHVAHVDAATHDLAQQVADALTPQGVVFAGLDVIGGKLSEINVTSPTGIQPLRPDVCVSQALFAGLA